MPNFILTLKLDTEIYQANILDKRLEISRFLYNACLGHLYEQYNSLKQTKLYKSAISNIKYLYRELKRVSNKKEKKNIEKEIKLKYKIINTLYKDYGINEYSLHNYIKKMQHHYSKNIDSFTAQKIATTVWRAFEKMLFGEAKKVYFKKQGELNSVEGKSNGTGIRFNENTLTWNKIKIPVIIKKKDVYTEEALNNKIKYCRIVRKLIRGNYSYYIQLILDGIPPVKYNLETGEIKNPINNGIVGIDIGTQTIAISSKIDVKLLELAPMINKINRQKEILQRKLDRQRRASNSDNYNENGTIKRGVKLTWSISNKYIQTKHNLAENQRKQAVLRKQSHEKLANRILSLGDEAIWLERLLKR